MGTVARSLVEQVQASHGGDPWYGTSRTALLAGLTPHQAAARPIPGAHSIWELVLHMTAWTREVARRLAGGLPALPADGDWPDVGKVSEPAWERAQAALTDAHAELVTSLRTLTPEEWQRIVGELREAELGTGVDVAGMIVGLAQHDAYHIGQIAVTRRAIFDAPEA